MHQEHHLHHLPHLPHPASGRWLIADRCLGRVSWGRHRAAGAELQRTPSGSTSRRIISPSRMRGSLAQTEIKPDGLTRAVQGWDAEAATRVILVRSTRFNVEFVSRTSCRFLAASDRMLNDRSVQQELYLVFRQTCTRSMCDMLRMVMT